MKIGVIGIGDIAKKAYLPITTRLKQVDLYIYSRNQETLDSIKKEYKSVTIVKAIEDLLTMDGVMIHATTDAHYQLCKTFLNKGIPVFVDKPVSKDIHEIDELYNIAKEKNLLFRVGFNRRYSTYVRKTKDLEVDVVIYQKNRFNLPGSVVDYIFDDFIHVVDTALYILKEEVESVVVKDHYKNDLLYSLDVTLQTKSKVAHLLMYRDSGATEEVIELFSQGTKYRIVDLNTMTEYKNDGRIEHKLNDWLPILDRRGFQGMIEEFIVDLENSSKYLLKDDLSLTSHQLCGQIYRIINK